MILGFSNAEVIRRDRTHYSWLVALPIILDTDKIDTMRKIMFIAVQHEDRYKTDHYHCCYLNCVHGFLQRHSLNGFGFMYWLHVQ